MEHSDWRDTGIGEARRILVSDILSIIDEYNTVISKGDEIPLGQVQTLVDSVGVELRDLARAGHRGIYLLDPLHYPDGSGHMVANEGGKVGSLLRNIKIWGLEKLEELHAGSAQRMTEFEIFTEWLRIRQVPTRYHRATPDYPQWSKGLTTTWSDGCQS